MININYEANSKEMTMASIAFLNVKPITRLATLATYLGSIFIIIVILIKFYMHQLALTDGVIAATALMWLFFRKKITEYILKKRIASQSLMGRNISITISNNGIIWDGFKVKDGQIDWNSFKTCYEITEGFIIPTSSTRFIWMPLHGFNHEDEVKDFKTILKRKKIKLISKLQY